MGEIYTGLEADLKFRRETGIEDRYLEAISMGMSMETTKNHPRTQQCVSGGRNRRDTQGNTGRKKEGAAASDMDARAGTNSKTKRVSTLPGAAESPGQTLISPNTRVHWIM